MRVAIESVAEQIGMNHEFLKEYIRSSDLQEGVDYEPVGATMELGETAVISFAKILPSSKYEILADIILDMNNDRYIFRKELDELHSLVRDVKTALSARESEKMQEQMTDDGFVLQGGTATATDDKEQTLPAGDDIPEENMQNGDVLPLIPLTEDSENASRLGEKRTMKCGKEAQIVVYNDSKDMTIRFEDKTVRTHIQYSTFKKGEVSDRTKEKKAEIAKALLGYHEKKAVYISPDNEEFTSFREMCRRYNITPSSTKRYVDLYHVTLAEYLKVVKRQAPRKKAEETKQQDNENTAPADIKQKPKARIRKDKKGDIPEVTDEKALSMYRYDGEDLPELTPKEIQWAKEVYGLMHSGHLTGKRDNEIRRFVYTRLKNVYGQVLSQSAQDYKKAYGLNGGTKVPYFRVVTQTPQLADLFMCILHDYHDGVLTEEDIKETAHA